MTVANVIADQSGSGGINNSSGNGNVEIGGRGVVDVTAANTYSGITIIDSGATLNVDPGGVLGTNTVTVNGTLNLNAGGTFANAVTDNGTLNVNTATTLSQMVFDFGTLNVYAASNFTGGVTDSGAIELDTNGTVTFASLAGSGSLTFGSGYNTTALVTGGLPSVTIRGFADGDTIDLRGVAATRAFLGAGNVLSLQNANGTIGTLNFDPAQTFGGLQFGLQSDRPGRDPRRLDPDRVPGRHGGGAQFGARHRQPGWRGFFAGKHRLHDNFHQQHLAAVVVWRPACDHQPQNGQHAAHRRRGFHP